MIFIHYFFCFHFFEDFGYCSQFENKEDDCVNGQCVVYKDKYESYQAVCKCDEEFYGEKCDSKIQKHDIMQITIQLSILVFVNRYFLLYNLPCKYVIKIISIRILSLITSEIKTKTSSLWLGIFMIQCTLHCLVRFLLNYQ